MNPYNPPEPESEPEHVDGIPDVLKFIFLSFLSVFVLTVYGIACYNSRIPLSLVGFFCSWGILFVTFRYFGKLNG